MLSPQEKWLLQGSLAAKKNELLSNGNCHLSSWIRAQHLGLSDLASVESVSTARHHKLISLI